MEAEERQDRDGHQAAGLFRVQALHADRRRLWGDLLLTQPPGTASAAVLVLAFLAALGALLAFGEFTRTERVAGYLVPDGGVIGVQTPLAGLVTRVLVREGDRVAAGARLVEVRDSRALAGGVDAGDAALATLDARLDRLASLRESERLRMAREAAADADALARLEARRALLASSRERLQAQLALVERSEARMAALERSGHVATQQREAVTGERLEVAGRLDSVRRSRLELDEEAARLRTRVDNWPMTRAARLAELDDRHDALVRERIETGGRTAFWLRAPRSGRVASLAVVEGEVARAGRDLLTLLEPQASMSAVLLVPSRAAGFVRAGQQVRLLYDAFPFTRFGVHAGEVVGVGRSILSPAELDAPARATEPVYKVRVRPRTDVIEAYGERVPLQAGMALEADIELERRRLWRWLFDPLLALGARL
ncbi:MAG TPA: HlyD family efflux transporter periplasmic adaptor subunit [Pseudomonadales bacterium]|nr:HlyD family efflux transporter periplasmic adaptor subunit [Pseudomonadales bacterium]